MNIGCRVQWDADVLRHCCIDHDMRACQAQQLPHGEEPARHQRDANGDLLRRHQGQGDAAPNMMDYHGDEGCNSMRNK